MQDGGSFDDFPSTRTVLSAEARSPGSGCDAAGETGASRCPEPMRVDRRAPSASRDFDIRLSHWAREFVASHSAGTPDIDESRVASLARLLQSGNEAAAWTVDDAATTAAFLICGTQRLIDRSKRPGRALPASLASTVAELCRRVVGTSAIPM
jgi:hypothetical protein